MQRRGSKDKGVVLEQQQNKVFDLATVRCHRREKKACNGSVTCRKTGAARRIGEKGITTASRVEGTMQGRRRCSGNVSCREYRAARRMGEEGAVVVRGITSADGDNGDKMC
ncbi:hypothetical protein HN51_013399 [Arachis hypogaea]